MTEDEDKCMICGCNYQIYGQDKICNECRTESGTLIEFGEQRATERVVGIIKKRMKILEKYRKMADESNQKTEEGWFYERLGELDSLLSKIESKKED